MKIYVVLWEYVYSKGQDPQLYLKCFRHREAAEAEYNSFAKRTADVATANDDCRLEKSSGTIDGCDFRAITLYQKQSAFIEHSDEVAEPDDQVEVWKESVTFAERIVQE